MDILEKAREGNGLVGEESIREDGVNDDGDGLPPTALAAKKLPRKELSRRPGPAEGKTERGGCSEDGGDELFWFR